MRLDTARCGCGRIIQLHSVSSRGVGRRCAECLAKVALPAATTEWVIIDSDYDQSTNNHVLDLFRRGRERFITLPPESFKAFIAMVNKSLPCGSHLYGAVITMFEEAIISVRAERPIEHPQALRVLFATRRRQPATDGWHDCAGWRFSDTNGCIALLTPDKREAMWRGQRDVPAKLPMRFLAHEGEVRARDYGTHVEAQTDRITIPGGDGWGGSEVEGSLNAFAHEYMQHMHPEIAKSDSEARWHRAKALLQGLGFHVDYRVMESEIRATHVHHAYSEHRKVSYGPESAGGGADMEELLSVCQSWLAKQVEGELTKVESHVQAPKEHANRHTNATGVGPSRLGPAKYTAPSGQTVTFAEYPRVRVVDSFDKDCVREAAQYGETLQVWMDAGLIARADACKMAREFAGYPEHSKPRDGQPLWDPIAKTWGLRLADSVQLARLCCCKQIEGTVVTLHSVPAGKLVWLSVLRNGPRGFAVVEISPEATKVEVTYT